MILLLSLSHPFLEQSGFWPDRIVVLQKVALFENMILSLPGECSGKQLTLRDKSTHPA